MPKAPRSSKKAWFEAISTTEIAKLYGVTPQAVGLWHSKTGCPRNKDGTYNLSQVIAWREERLREKPTGGAQDAADTPAKERKLEAEARLAEIKIGKEERKIIPRDEIHDLMMSCAGILRSTGEILQRNHGNAAQGVLNEGLDTFAEEVKRRLG